ncbi:uncharacterized protein LOC108037075 [Drosophila rhopaloa]|uniref:Uncharacterized protein LOC108037075 n=1 Tax=Drosophila rhopaloa TaxID=1041015 RepID=A0A6P4DY44_DRORH|nr:uncharacterized protein LOC108037075 [Drosophila rhopaloa]
MGKKYKSKSGANLKKVPVTEAKEEPETPRAKSPKNVEAKCAVPKELPPKISMEKAKMHQDQMSALATMPLRLDQKIQCIKTVQQELFKLHMQQLTLLDDCTEFLKELNAVQSGNNLEEKLVLETFVLVKAKLSDVFEHFLPAQLDMLKHETKILHVSNQLMSK